MTFEFSIGMRLPLAAGTLGLYIVLNRKKVHEINKRWNEGRPKMLQRTYRDPEGRRNVFGAAGMVVLSVLGIVGMGTGFIET